jgi:hypothetical protein
VILPKVEHALTHTDFYESLWREPWKRIETALNSFARGDSQVEEMSDIRLSVVTLAPAIFAPGGFEPSRDAAPFTAISHQARGELFLIATPMNDGWAYRIDYPYYSWAETVVRPRIPRHDFTSLVAELNSVEQSESSRWEIDRSELSSAIKFRDRNGLMAPSRLSPDVVAGYTRSALTETRAADATHA